MNYLAHCCLVPPTPEALAGSLLGDIWHGPDLSALPEAIAAAVRLHRQVDRWTDAHPENVAARALFQPPLRRFAGIVCDVSYDHFLARDFAAIEGRSLRAFADAVYEAIRTFEHLAPGKSRPRLQYIYRNDLLFRYRHWDDTAAALDGIASRLSRPSALQNARAEIEPLLPALAEHFRIFYPQLKAFAAGQWEQR